MSIFDQLSFNLLEHLLNQQVPFSCQVLSPFAFCLSCWPFLYFDSTSPVIVLPPAVFLLSIPTFFLTASLKALKIADELSAAGCSVGVCFQEGKKDFGDMSKKDVNQALKSTLAHDKYNTLRHKIGIMRSGSIF